jgi:hypothetical protein
MSGAVEGRVCSSGGGLGALAGGDVMPHAGWQVFRQIILWVGGVSSIGAVSLVSVPLMRCRVSCCCGR